MDHAATMRRAYDLLNAGDIDGFGELLADDFVEHEETPGLAPTREGVMEFFRMYRAAFPDVHMHVEDVLPSGDKVVARMRATGTHEVNSWECLRPERASMSRSSTSFALATTVWHASTGASSTP